MKTLYLFLFLLMLPFAAYADTNTVTSTVTGTTTVDKTPPTASAPSVVINNQDVCSTASSAAIQTQVLGFAGGTAIRDMNCERLKLARSLYGMGMKVAAVSMLCQDERVFDAMMMAGTPCPYEGKIGKEAKKLWEENGPRDIHAKEEDAVDVDEGVAFGAGALLLFLLL